MPWAVVPGLSSNLRRWPEGQEHHPLWWAAWIAHPGAQQAGWVCCKGDVGTSSLIQGQQGTPHPCRVCEHRQTCKIQSLSSQAAPMGIEEYPCKGLDVISHYFSWQCDPMTGSQTPRPGERLQAFQGLGNADCGVNLVCCCLFWLSQRFSVLCRIPLMLGSPCVSVLSSGTWEHDFLHNEGQRTIVCMTRRTKGNVGWHWSQEQEGWAQGSFLFWKCFYLSGDLERTWT